MELENPNRFTNLRVSGFRRLQSVEFPLRPLCVMIGANGVGKTSMLDVFSLLASSADGRLTSTMSELGGVNSVLSFAGATDIEFSIFAVADGRKLGYELQLRPEGIAYRFEGERLWLRQQTEFDHFEHITARGSDVQYEHRHHH